MTNEEIMQRFYDEIKLRNMSHHTAESYESNIRLFIKHFNNACLEDLTEEHMRQYLIHLLEKGQSTGSVRICNCAFRFFYQKVMDRQINISRLPQCKHHYKLPEIMSQEQLKIFFASIDNFRDKVMLMTVYGAGLRASEITGLRIQDIDSKDMRIFINKGKGSKDRFAMLSEENLLLLREYWKQYRPNHYPEGYLFYPKNNKSRRMTTRAVQDIMKKYLSKARLPRHFTVHSLRHAFATSHLENKVDLFTIKHLLGHASIRTTAIYLHFSGLNTQIKSPLSSILQSEESDD